MLINSAVNTNKDLTQTVVPLSIYSYWIRLSNWLEPVSWLTVGDSGLVKRLVFQPLCHGCMHVEHLLQRRLRHTIIRELESCRIPPDCGKHLWNARALGTHLLSLLVHTFYAAHDLTVFAFGVCSIPLNKKKLETIDGWIVESDIKVKKLSPYSRLRDNSWNSSLEDQMIIACNRDV